MRVLPGTAQRSEACKLEGRERGERGTLARPPAALSNAVTSLQSVLKVCALSGSTASSLRVKVPFPVRVALCNRWRTPCDEGRSTNQDACWHPCSRLQLLASPHVEPGRSLWDLVSAGAAAASLARANPERRSSASSSMVACSAATCGGAPRRSARERGRGW